MHKHSLVLHRAAGLAWVVNRRDSSLAALVATIWGFNFVVIDWGMNGGSAEMPPLLFAAIRFSVVVFPAVLLVPRPDAPWRVVLGVGVFMSLGQFGLLYVSMAAGMPPGLAALVLQAQVIFTVLIAAAVLRERPTPAQVAGIGVGAVGLLVVGGRSWRTRDRRRPGALPPGRAVVGHRQRRVAGLRSAGRPEPHRVVGGGRAAAARGPVPSGGRTCGRG